MPTELSASAQKVQAALSAAGVACQVIELSDSTRTAQEAAQAIGCRVEQIVKSLVFRGRQTGRPVLVLASGPNRVNEKRVGQLLGEPIERADADFVRAHTGFVIGGIPPLGLAEPLISLIDEDLLGYDALWAAAGTPHAVFRLTAADLQRINGGTVTAIK
jgi:prolyl-tRNA editing enzyme YbaK/EbsC (Cys-tRNA(Pro) deacylase)